MSFAAGSTVRSDCSPPTRASRPWPIRWASRPPPAFARLSGAELARCFARLAPESRAKAGGGREAHRIGHGLDALVGGEQSLRTVDPAANDMLADRHAAAFAESAGQLPDRQVAEAGELAERRGVARFGQPFVDDPQAPGSETAGRRLFRDRRAVAGEFDRDLRHDQFDQDLAREAGLPRLAGEAQEQAADGGI